MTSHEEFAEWDAAYVLGALTPADRRAFESHLETCERCRAAVSELAPIPGLLTRAQPFFEEPDAVAGPPSNLVDLVAAREAKRQRTARRRIAFAAVGTAAVLALGIAIPAVVQQDTIPEPAAVVALAPVAATPLTASVSFDNAAWGTSISMTCTYPAAAPSSPYPGGATATTYTLVVTDAAGETEQVASWTAMPGDTVTLDAGTALTLGQIQTVELRSATGEVLLEAPVA